MTSIPSNGYGSRTNQRSIGSLVQSVLMMVSITVIMVGGIGARLAYLQLIQGTRNRQLAENNRIRLIPTQPVRGNIFDRNGKILATSSLSHTVYLWPSPTPELWLKPLNGSVRLSISPRTSPGASRSSWI